MPTATQQKHVNAFFADLALHPFGIGLEPVYRELMEYLAGLGYFPYKQRSYLVFKHDRHGKQMAKMGFKIYKDKPPFFALRFSACRGYSKRFEEIVRNAVSKENHPRASCLNGSCGYCGGEPDTHVYVYVSPGGAAGTHCGAQALEIPDISAGDVGEIKTLILEEHVYLMLHQAGVSEEETRNSTK